MKTDIKQNDFKEGLPQEFEVMELSFLRETFYEEITEPHRNEFYQILWFTDGECTHSVDFNEIKIPPNTLLFVNKNSVQQFDKSQKSNGNLILFTDDFFCKTISDSNFLKTTILFNDLLSIPTITTDNNKTVFLDILELIKSELHLDKDSLQNDLVRNYLHNFLLVSERERRKQGFGELKNGPDLTLVMNFRELLEGQFYQEKRVSQYVLQLLITKKKLNIATSKILGKTPKRIIDERVMLEAKRLLSYTHSSVKEIGYSLGFKEPTNFVKYFKKLNKTTPNDFRESLKKVN